MHVFSFVSRFEISWFTFEMGFGLVNKFLGGGSKEGSVDEGKWLFFFFLLLLGILKNAVLQKDRILMNGYSTNITYLLRDAQELTGKMFKM